MGWEKILKRKTQTKYTSLTNSDIKVVNYILRDGEFKTVDAIMDGIYDLIAENKKLGQLKRSKMKGRPQATKFGESRRKLMEHMTKSPAYESRDTGNKNHVGTPIKEYRYIGE